MKLTCYSYDKLVIINIKKLLVTFMHLLYVMLGGFAGAISRYIVDTLFITTTFPIATLLTNVAGSFLLGVLFAYVDKKRSRNGIVERLFGIGFLGSFTTFSTFSIDALLLLESGQFMQAFFYVLGTPLLSIVSAYIGIKVITKRVRSS